MSEKAAQRESLDAFDPTNQRGLVARSLITFTASSPPVGEPPACQTRQQRTPHDNLPLRARHDGTRVNGDANAQPRPASTPAPILLSAANDAAQLQAGKRYPRFGSGSKSNGLIAWRSAGVISLAASKSSTHSESYRWMDDVPGVNSFTDRLAPSLVPRASGEGMCSRLRAPQGAPHRNREG